MGIMKRFMISRSARMEDMSSTGPIRIRDQVFELYSVSLTRGFHTPEPTNPRGKERPIFPDQP